MILTQQQLARIVLFSQGEDVVLDPSFAGQDKGEVSINVGRESDRSFIRIEPGGQAWVVSSGSRTHEPVVLCWCGERHAHGLSS